MKNQYFEGCKSADEIRSRYFELAKKYHPDMGGDLEIMQEVNVQYAFACGRQSRKDAPNMDRSHYDAMRDIDEILRKVIIELVKLEGLTIEICGLWIWVGGSTFIHKDRLKALGLKFASKKRLWFYAGIPCRSYRGVDMNRIRIMYGSRMVTNDDLI